MQIMSKNTIEINDFLERHKLEIKSLIEEFDLNIEFSSHDFIEKFIVKFESDYIEMLVKYQKSGQAFRKVHGMMARFLSLNMSNLRIVKTLRKGSENVRGKIDNIQWWMRIN